MHFWPWLLPPSAWKHPLVSFLWSLALLAPFPSLAPKANCFFSSLFFSFVAALLFSASASVSSLLLLQLCPISLASCTCPPFQPKTGALQ